MTLRAKGARKRRGNSPRRKEEGTVKVCPEAGRERRLIYGHLGAPREQPSTENVAPRPPGREHSSRMLGDGSPSSLTFDQAMLTSRHVAPVRLIRAVP